MAKLPERYEHLEHRDGVLPYSVLSVADCRRAIRRTLPTRHRAKQFFDAVVALLGERAFVDETFAPDDLRVHVRAAEDARLVIGAPLVRLTRGPGQSQTVMRLVNKDAVLPEEAPDGWQPGDPPWAPPTELRPEILPRGPEMCGGAINLAEGHGRFEVEYDERGVRGSGTETGGDTFIWLRRAATAPYHLDTLSRPPSQTPLSMLARAGLDPAGHTVEQLAALLVAGELEQRVAWRVHMPVPLPMTIEGIVLVARIGLRTAMFAGEIPAEARWAVADGFEGRAVAWGDTIDDALEKFTRVAFAKKPRPPGTSAKDDAEPEKPPPPIEPPSTKTSEDGKSTTISTGTMHISIPARPLKFPWPRAIPRTCPRCSYHWARCRRSRRSFAPQATRASFDASASMARSATPSCATRTTVTRPSANTSWTSSSLQSSMPTSRAPRPSSTRTFCLGSATTTTSRSVASCSRSSTTTIASAPPPAWEAVSWQASSGRRSSTATSCPGASYASDAQAAALERDEAHLDRRSHVTPERDRSRRVDDRRTSRR